jgi:hypothetical protein
MITCACCKSSTTIDNVNGNFCDSKNDLPVCDGCLQNNPIFETDDNGTKTFTGRYKTNNGMIGLSSPEERFHAIINKETHTKDEKKSLFSKIKHWWEK